MPLQTAVVLGATGLTGNHLVGELVKDKDYNKVRLLVRRPMQVADEKLDVQVTDFSNLSDFRDKLGNGNVIFCCIGTTMQKVKGDKKAYRQVDYDIPVNAAKLGIEAGFHRFSLLSSVGANAASPNFYLQLKGRVEQEIAKLPYRSADIFQPSLLTGDRTERRLAEILFKPLMQGLSFLFIGNAIKYKPVAAIDVARAMVVAARINKPGTNVYRYGEMKSLLAQR